MSENIQSPDNLSHGYDRRLLKLENEIEILKYKLTKEIPNDLADRLIIIEQRFESLKYDFDKSDLVNKIGYFENEIDNMKKEVSAEKGRMKERTAFIAIIVSLITYLVSLLY